MDYILERCPHCKEQLFIYKKELNCRIFRHGFYKKNLKQINPHLKKEICDNLFKKKLIYGCGKPFRIDKNNKAIKCGYI